MNGDIFPSSAPPHHSATIIRCDTDEHGFFPGVVCDTIPRTYDEWQSVVDSFLLALPLEDISSGLPDDEFVRNLAGVYAIVQTAEGGGLYITRNVAGFPHETELTSYLTGEDTLLLPDDVPSHTLGFVVVESGDGKIFAATYPYVSPPPPRLSPPPENTTSTVPGGVLSEIRDTPTGWELVPLPGMNQNKRKLHKTRLYH